MDTREAARTPSRDTTGINLIFRYYNLLYYVERRFFPYGECIADENWASEWNLEISVSFELSEILTCNAFDISSLVESKSHSVHCMLRWEANFFAFRECIGSFIGKFNLFPLVNFIQFKCNKLVFWHNLLKRSTCVAFMNINPLTAAEPMLKSNGTVKPN